MSYWQDEIHLLGDLLKNFLRNEHYRREARVIRLAARTLEPFSLESPKFLTSLLCLLDRWLNFRSIDLPGGCCSHFSNKKSWQIRNMNIFIFLFKMAEICEGGGYNLRSGKQMLAIKISFHVNKPGFSGVNVGIGDSFSSQKADLYYVIFLKIGQLFT